MRIPGLKTAKIFSRWVQAHLLGGAIILGYHRIADVSRDEYEVCVTPDHFAEHMEVVSKYTHPISLSELVKHLENGSPAVKSVAVTFDDGYADNLYQAKPVLEKYDVPATVFACTGNAGKEFWWDELVWLVMSSRAEPHGLRLQVGERPFEWHQPNVRFEAESPEAGLLRRQFRHALYQFLLSLDMIEREDAMNTIRSWSGLTSNGTSAHRTMNHTELLKLTEGGLIEIGAHTRTHPMLPRLSVERQREEILSSKQDLQELLGRQVTGFAYPNGRATEEAKGIVREAGFVYACTSLHDMVRPGCDMYELTRFWQRNVDGDRFLQGLRLWMKLRGNHA